MTSKGEEVRGSKVRWNAREKKWFDDLMKIEWEGRRR